MKTPQALLKQLRTNRQISNFFLQIGDKDDRESFETDVKWYYFGFSVDFRGWEIYFR